jgi:hypothetical protein
MKYIFQIPIFLLMLWASGVSYATHSVALIDGKIDAYVKNACSDGSATGAIDLEIIGGTGPYEVTYKDAAGVVVHHASVDGSAGPGFTGDEDALDLLPGVYTVLVTDNTCAVAQMVVEVGVHDPIVIDANPENICQEGTGQISPTVTGGQGGYTFAWSNGATTQNITNLSTGTFTVTVTDVGGCSMTSTNVIENNEIMIESQPTTTICEQATGSISVSVSGGSGNYSYLWSNGFEEAEIFSLDAGTYTVTVTDEGGCSDIISYDVLESNLTISASTAPICQQASGSFSPIVTGGQGGYTFAWSNGATTQNITNLGAGTYTLTVTDGSGCSAIRSYVHGYPISFPSNFITISSTCNQENGQIITQNNQGSYIGGNYPLKYQWSNGSTMHNLSNLAAGLYTVTVTGADGCTGIKEQSVGSEGVNITLEEIEHVCEVGREGNIYISVDRPSIFEWSENNGSTYSDEYNYDLSNLTEGTYCVTITEIETGCTLHKCYDIGAEDPVQIISTQTTGTCSYSNKGSATVTHINGIVPYKYKWIHIESGTVFTGSSLSNHHTINNLYKGNYIVTVTDACSRTSVASCVVESEDFNVEVEINHGCKVTGINLLTNTYTAYEGNINVTINGVNPPYHVVLKGQRNFSKSFYSENGLINFNNLENADFHLSVTDSKGCKFEKQVTVQTLIIGFKYDEIIKPCANTNSGSIKYYIKNPRGLIVKANFLGILVFETSKKEDEFILGNLYSGIILINWQTNEGCNFAGDPIKISDKPTDKVFKRFNKATNLCVYDDVCEGEVLATDSYMESPTIDIVNGTRRTCNVPIKCRDKVVDEIDGSLKLIRGGHYVTLAESLKDQFPVPENIDFDIDRVYKLGPCILWWYCPLTLRIWAQAWYVEGCSILSQGDWESDHVVLGSCSFLSCCFPSQSTVCIENIIEEHDIPIDPTLIKEISLCLPKTMNIAQLIVYENELKAKYPEYNESTELYKFLHNIVLLDPANRRKSICAEVRFCLKNFKVLFDNLKEIDCGIVTNYKIDPLEANEYWINENGKIELISPPISTNYHSSCVINQKGTGICSLGPKEILCPEQPPAPAPIIFCPRLLKDDDPIYARQLVCGDDLIDVVYDSLMSEFIIFWVGNRNDFKILVGEKRYDNLMQKIHHDYFSQISNNSVNYNLIRSDLTNVYVYESSDISANWIKKDLNGDNIWSIPLSNFNIKNISDGTSGTYDLIGFDKASQKWMSKTISSDGAITEEKSLPIKSPDFDLVHQSGNTTIAYQKEAGNITFAKDNGTLVKQVPSGITLKDIKTLDNGNVLVVGEFSGSMTVAGVAYNSDGNKNAIFLTYDQSGNLLSGKSVQNYRDETVNGIATKGNDEVAYHGKYQEIVSYAINPEDNVIDSCIFINIIKLTDPCTTFTSTLVHDGHNCQLTWDTPPSGYTTSLQYQINGVWVDVSVAFGMDVVSSPFTVAKDGSFRLISKKQGCPDVVSNIITTACLNSCVCPVPSMVYDQTACTLTWSITECTGYTVSLQRLNSANGWETIVQQATSPFNIITNGTYRLSVSKGMNTIGNACPTVLSNTVATACTPSSNACSCAPATLSHNTASCSLSWTASSCTGYTIALQRNIAGVWTTINASSPYTIPANSNGSYRIVRSKSGCTDLLSNVVNVTCSCSSPASITIFDYGTSGLGQNATILKGQSYTHEVSQGAPDACDESYIQLAFASSDVNSNWTFYVNGSVAVMPGTVIGSQFVVDLYLPTPPSGGTADVFMQSPCGDFYQLHLVYDCDPECVYIPCQSFSIMDDCINLNLVEVGNLSHSVSGSWFLTNGCFSQSAIQLASNIRNKIIEIYPYCDANNLEVYFTKEDGVGVFLVIENSPMDIVAINYNSYNSQDISYCPPLNCTCPEIMATIEGDNVYSCENLTIYASNGTAPYTYVITGIGSDGTQINQSGSTNIINLSSLQQNESIDLNIQVLDANGCEYSTLTTYSRCNNTCLMGPLGKMECVCANLNYVSVNTTGCHIQSVNVTLCGAGSSGAIYYLYNNLGSELLHSSNLQQINNEIASNGNGVYYMNILCSCGYSNTVQFIINCPNYSNGNGSNQRLSNTSQSKLDIIRFYPNPFSKGINLELTSENAGSLDLEVFNNLGLQVFKKSLDLQQGINLQYIEEFENVPSGVYTVKIKSDTKDYTSRVIKVD